MGNSNSSPPTTTKSSDSAATSDVDNKKKKAALIKPKHILWGCTTVGEHYDAVQKACDMVANEHGLEGLQKLGFEFRKVHANPCTCQQHEDIDVESLLSEDELNDASNDDFDDDDDDDDDSGGVPDDNNDDNDITYDNEYENNGLTQEQQQPLQKEEEHVQAFMVPTGTRINDLEIKEPPKTTSRDSCSSSCDVGGGIFQQELKNNPASSLPSKSRRFSRNQSSVSLFSLATHHSMSSNESSSINPLQNNGNYQRHPVVQIHGHTHEVDDHAICSLRLFHVPSDTMITEKVHQTFIAHGKMYDEIARLCMEYSQDLMIEYGNLEWVTVCEKRDIRALASINRSSRNSSPENSGDDDDDDDDDNNNGSSNPNIKSKRKPTLVVITGKGKVGAGIFSRRFCMTLGMEPSTALPFVQEAMRRDMAVIILDPNSKEAEKINAMEVVEASLERLCFQNNNNIINGTISSNDDDDGDNDNDGIYVLAHSMAGSQLVRFLLNKAENNYPSLREEDGSSVANDHDKNADENSDDAVLLESYLGQIKAIAFTDSNHNINWVKKYPRLTDFFTCNKSLYIKSHKVHEDAKALGQLHHDCRFWRHRFGTIKTLWAGTNEHALTNHTARFHIWDHFDAFR